MPIRLFVTDIDGCLAEPFRAFPWKAFARLRAWQARARRDPLYPPITVLTGRPLPYAEAVAQALDLEGPFAFESGGGLFDLRTYQVRWSDAIGPEQWRQLEEARRWVLDGYACRYPQLFYEYAKRTQVGLVSPDASLIERLYAEMAPLIEARFPDLVLHRTPISLDLVVRGADKGQGLLWLCRAWGASPEEVAYIGDSSGDLPALRQVGFAFAPANAAAAVREAPVRVLPVPWVEAVEMAYRWAVAHNRASVKSL
ncbi:MAG: Cof-type HAD-IIB family hydrolase [Bacteroidetes bacterium]|nr:Cof-type HAD-IIB family hydrolase [Rhodothermia bacterium]MCS7155182.1 Cof-type HAD-IIB family hydrolase [Bacteroidota bacterium]MCX7906191.1 Cof-type HAD-IIB family hydrolase [Bacteroidota bacterium]MDW8138318.1 HAD family hydrolase [Bacteroidota bacterium]MDW8286003.1 HAD family hydrolase [Bacteroidota bacterium]